MTSSRSIARKMTDFDKRVKQLCAFYYYNVDKDGFCVNFDVAWRLCGYTQKGQAKQRLMTLAIKPKEGVDYIVKPLTKTKGRGGYNRQDIWMTSRTFNEFALTACTDESRALIDAVFDLSKAYMHFKSKLDSGEVRIEQNE